MDKWSKVTLGDICDVKGGKRLPKGSVLTDAPTPHPYIRVRDLNNKRIVDLDESFEYVDIDTQKSISRYIVNSGDIIISIVGTIGLVSIVGETLHNANLTENCVKLVNFSNADPLYIYYFLQSVYGQDEIAKGAVGAVQAKLPIKNIQDIRIYTPPLSEQRRIAAILSALDDKIELNNQINKNLEAQAQALFVKLIIEGNSHEPWGVFSDIAEINPPRILKRGNKAIYIEMSNLPTNGSFPINWEAKEFAGGMKFKNGDTLVARITPCLENGKTAYINFLDEDEVAFGSTEYIVITSRADYCKEMFYFFARHTDFVRYAILNMNGSSGRQRVSSDIIGNYRLRIPTIESSREFEKLAAPVMDIIKRNSVENLTLAAIRDSLLPKLISGEITPPPVDPSSKSRA